MPKRQLKREDYVFCEKCEVAVPKAKVVAREGFFTGKTTECCPYCGEPKLVAYDTDED